MKLRIIPATIATAALLLCVKVVEVTRGTESLLIPMVEAQAEAPKTDAPVAADKPATPAAEEKKPEAAPAAEVKKPDAPAAAAIPPGTPAVDANPFQAPEAAKPDEKKADANAKPEDAKKDEAKGDTKEGDKKEGGEKKEAKCDNGKKKNKDNPNVSETPGETTDHRFTAVELELLQSLSKRREELDRWDRNIQIKESALDATEKRVNDKIGQIEAMKKEVADLLAQYNTQEDAKIKSLVKIYENMKPKDAARIFDEVEMPILLLVIDKMSEKKAAPILAEMNPLKAKQITVLLAEQRRVNTAKINVPGNSAPPPKTAQP